MKPEEPKEAQAPPPAAAAPAPNKNMAASTHLTLGKINILSQQEKKPVAKKTPTAVSTPKATKKKTVQKLVSKPDEEKKADEKPKEEKKEEPKKEEEKKEEKKDEPKKEEKKPEEAKKEDKKEEPEPAAAKKTSDEAFGGAPSSDDPYYDADFKMLEMGDEMDYANEERKALSQPLRISDMQNMERSIAAIAKEVSAGVGETKRIKGPVMQSKQRYDNGYSDYYDHAEGFDDAVEEASPAGWSRDSYFRRRPNPYSSGLF